MDTFYWQSELSLTCKHESSYDKATCLEGNLEGVSLMILKLTNLQARLKVALDHTNNEIEEEDERWEDPIPTIDPSLRGYDLCDKTW